MENLIQVGDFALNSNKHSLRYKRKKLNLSFKEFQLAKYLLKNTNKVKSRTEILEDVWDRNIFCNTNTVDVHISTLRKKFKKISAPNKIKTIYCVGYMFEN